MQKYRIREYYYEFPVVLSPLDADDDALPRVLADHCQHTDRSTFKSSVHDQVIATDVTAEFRATTHSRAGIQLQVALFGLLLRDFELLAMLEELRGFWLSCLLWWESRLVISH
jgi:hypothetical protein